MVRIERDGVVGLGVIEGGLGRGWAKGRQSIPGREDLPLAAVAPNPFDVSNARPIVEMPLLSRILPPLDFGTEAFLLSAQLRCKFLA